MLHHTGRLIRHIYVWVRRFRHRRGYGVHSPFAYNLIKGVFYERGTYYAYDALHTLHKTAPKHEKQNTERVNKLLFRFANYVEPKTIWLCGNHTRLTAHYLQAACPDARIIRVTNEEEGRKAKASAIPPDLLCIVTHQADPEMLTLMAQKANPHAATVWCGIHETTAGSRMWKKAMQQKGTGVTFDLYDAGIIFYNNTLQKQHYIINF